MKRALLGALIALAACACNAGTGPVASSAETVAVTRVLDGDSLLADLDGRPTDVRLLGINAPEQDECYHDQAQSRLTELAGERVVLVGSERDRFGRLLAYVYTPAGDLVNRRLVAEGLALALTTGHELLDEFKAAEGAAFEARLGRWQADACGPSAGAEIRIDHVEYDAPGDDARNPNGEWVEITNQGEAAASLDGWSVADESSSHRFFFPNGFTLAPRDRVRVSSGCGEDTAHRLFWCDGDPVWSNGGDTAYLLDPAGNVVDRLAF